MTVICIRKCIYAPATVFNQQPRVHPSRDRLYYYVITSYSQHPRLIQTPHVYQLSALTLHHLYTQWSVYP